MEHIPVTPPPVDEGDACPAESAGLRWPGEWQRQRGRYALMRGQRFLECYAVLEDARRTGLRLWGEGGFWIQDTADVAPFWTAVGLAAPVQQTRLDDQVSRNYKVFAAQLPELLREHRGRFALLHDEELFACYMAREDARRTAVKLWGWGNYSIQTVTDKPANLGFLFRPRARGALQISRGGHFAFSL